MESTNGKVGSKSHGKKKEKAPATTEPHLSPEREVVTEVTICIRGYGHPEKVLIDHLTTVGRMMSRAFGKNFEMTAYGKPYTFDPLAADGEHVGHIVVLKEEA